MNTLECLLERRSEIASKRLVVGFDGFVDTLVKPVRQSATADTPAQMFDTIREFGEFLVGCAQKSCSIELKVEAKQLGGNLPYLSRCAGGLGLDVTCIGMLGDNGIVEPLFQEMPCTLYPFAAAGQSTSFEFRDGKVFFATEFTLPRDPWQTILDATGGKAPALFYDADLIALVNWSELSFAQKLWEAVYVETLASKPCDKTRFAFFDLCDCSRRTDDEIDAVLFLIGRFSQKRTTIISVNENEAHVIANRILNCACDSVMIGKTLRERYHIDEVLVHTIRDSLLVSEQGMTLKPTDFVECPKISTGAGDNFNAAFCFGTVMGLDDEERVAFANRFANFYISHGYSPVLDEII